jgi:hypothetical protein
LAVARRRIHRIRLIRARTFCEVDVTAPYRAFGAAIIPATAALPTTRSVVRALLPPGRGVIDAGNSRRL